MKKIGVAALCFIILMATLQSCKKDNVAIVDYSVYTTTDAECRVISAPDTLQWTNNVLSRYEDTAFLIFADNINITDTTTAKITISPPCPNPSNGFFIWNVTTTRQCKLKVVCINKAQDVLYYNAYALTGGPITLAFDFRAQTVFHKDSNFRMYYAFYNATDSMYFSGHGDLKIF